MATQGSYPHPVVGHRDDVDSTFEISAASVIPTAEHIEVKLRLRMDDPDLIRMRDAREAALVFRWSCAATLATGLLKATVAARHADGETWVATIDQQDVRDVVQIDVRAIASCPIEPYVLSRQHSDYGRQTFAVRPGDVIGVAGSFEFRADKLFDPFRPPVGSCFRLVEDPDQKKGLKVQLQHDDQVVVSMSPQVRLALQHLGDQPDHQVALVVLPALMHALIYIRTNESAQDEDVTDKTWYRTILELANKMGGLEEPIIELAQRILEFPIDKAIEARSAVQEDEE